MVPAPLTTAVLAYDVSVIVAPVAAAGVPAAEHVPPGQVTVTVVAVTLDTTHTLLYVLTEALVIVTTLPGEKVQPHAPHVTVKEPAAVVASVAPVKDTSVAVPPVTSDTGLAVMSWLVAVSDVVESTIDVPVVPVIVVHTPLSTVGTKPDK
jgi:hypothetical protein